VRRFAEASSASEYGEIAVFGRSDKGVVEDCDGRVAVFGREQSGILTPVLTRPQVQSALPHLLPPAGTSITSLTVVNGQRRDTPVEFNQAFDAGDAAGAAHLLIQTVDMRQVTGGLARPGDGRRGGRRRCHRPPPSRPPSGHAVARDSHSYHSDASTAGPDSSARLELDGYDRDIVHLGREGLEIIGVTGNESDADTEPLCSDRHDCVNRMTAPSLTEQLPGGASKQWRDRFGLYSR
jgi:hypothetical protein